MPDTRILVGDVRDVLKTLEDESVHTVVTSPPYWRLRDYETHDQIGQEATLDEYVETLAEVSEEAQRVLHPEGTFWLNLGDVYHRGEQAMLPEMVAFRLRQDGWYLRAKVIWHKPNAFPQNAQRHPGLDYETLLMLTGRERHHYDAIAVKVPAKWERWGKQTVNKYAGRTETSSGWIQERTKEEIEAIGAEGKRHLRQVWSIPTGNYTGLHMATFPEALVEPCVLASCPAGGTVLDPFFGSGTTGVVANRLGRDCIGIELNPEYAQLAIDRLVAAAA